MRAHARSAKALMVHSGFTPEGVRGRELGQEEEKERERTDRRRDSSPIQNIKSGIHICGKARVRSKDLEV